ncbi:MAG: hypothetical protein JNL54_05175 [Kineosporiaceae bacterium]|nr:hypothetical protein [Kineosporiaceae bacterium]
MLGFASPSTAARVGTFDLSITATGTVTGRAGQIVAVNISWGNAGPAAAVGVVVSYLPPLGTEIPAGQVPAGWSKSGRSVTRLDARMAARASRSAAIPLLIGATIAPGTLLVGGTAEVRATGTDRTPGNNRAVSRVRVQAATASPSPSRTPSPTRTATPTPSRTSVATTTAQATPSTTRGGVPRATPATQAVRQREPSLRPSTFVVAAPSASIQPDIVEIIDPPSDTAAWLLPTLGAITCFTAAGIAAVGMRRRRAAERAHQDEVRYLQKVP